MKKTNKFVSMLGNSLLGLFIFASKVHADIPGGSKPIPPDKSGNTVLIVVGIGIGIVVLISWLIIRGMKKNKNVDHK